MNRRIFMPGLGEYVTIKPVAPIDVLLESKCTKVSIQVATVRETIDRDYVLTFRGWTTVQCALWRDANQWCLVARADNHYDDEQKNNHVSEEMIKNDKKTKSQKIILEPYTRKSYWFWR